VTRRVDWYVQLCQRPMFADESLPFAYVLNTLVADARNSLNMNCSVSNSRINSSLAARFCGDGRAVFSINSLISFSSTMRASGASVALGTSVIVVGDSGSCMQTYQPPAESHALPHDLYSMCRLCAAD
jgi:hypothetical protein